MSGNRSPLPRELHARSSAGIQVSLWWSPASGQTRVAVRDARAGAGFVLPVHAGERARDVFDHPYAHAARHGIPTSAGLSRHSLCTNPDSPVWKERHELSA